MLPIPSFPFFVVTISYQDDYDDYWNLLNAAYDHEEEMEKIDNECNDDDDNVYHDRAKLRMSLNVIELDNERWWE